MSGLYDLSVVVRERMLLYPGDPAPGIERVSSIEEGAVLTASALALSCHAGTHVDAPAHFLAGGRMLSDYPIEAFCGPAVVLDLEAHRHVTAAAVRPLAVPEHRHILLRTRNSWRLGTREYDRGHAYVEIEAAEALIARRPRSVGFDYYSLDSFADAALPVHRRLADAGILVYVCLDLSAIPAGACTFFGLPLRLDGVEAAPVRAIALRAE